MSTSARRSDSRRIPSRWLAPLLSCAMLFAVAAHAGSLPVDDDMFVTNGTVDAVARAGNHLYVGGSFTQVGKPGGGLLATDPATGVLPAGFPHVDGSVFAVCPDGAGGFYLGGYFTAVGGVARANLAHVDASFSVLPWNPGTDNTVLCLTRDGSTLWAGGYFSTVGGQSHACLAGMQPDANVIFTNTPVPSTAIFSLQVRDIAVRGDTVYVVGEFGRFGGLLRSCAAAFRKDLGAVLEWNPNAQGGTWNSGFGGYSTGVNAIVVTPTTVYLGGDFTTIGGAARNRLAAVDAVLGNATTWNPAGNGIVHELVSTGSKLYVAGAFSSMCGQSRRGLAELETSTLLATSWDPALDGDVTDLTLDGSTLYAAGTFTHAGATARARLASWNLTSGSLTAWDPGTSITGGFVYGLGASSTVACVAGNFALLGAQTRNNLAEFDATTGAVTSWNPNVDGPVLALDASGPSVIAGGTFSHVGALARVSIAAIDPATGVATSWDPGIRHLGGTGDVNAFVSDGATLFVGGRFETTASTARTNLAAFDLASGALASWDPGADNRVYALARDGAIVYAGGLFANAGGSARGRIAALDAASGVATAWNPTADDTVFALATDGSTVYAGGRFAHAGGATRSRITAIDAASGVATAWNPAASATVRALALTGASVFAGGDFTTIGGQSRARLAELATSDGNATLWSADANASVLALDAGGPTLLAGGAFTTIDLSPRRSFVSLPLSVAGVAPGTGASVADARAFPNPFVDRVAIAFTVPRSGRVRLDVLDVAGRRVWSDARVFAAGAHALAWNGTRTDGARAAAGLYFLRVSGAGLEVTRRVARVR